MFTSMLKFIEYRHFCILSYWPRDYFLCTKYVLFHQSWLFPRSEESIFVLFLLSFHLVHEITSSARGTFCFTDRVVISYLRKRRLYCFDLFISFWGVRKGRRQYFLLFWIDSFMRYVETLSLNNSSQMQNHIKLKICCLPWSREQQTCVYQSSSCLVALFFFSLKSLERQTHFSVSSFECGALSCVVLHCIVSTSQANRDIKKRNV